MFFLYEIHKRNQSQCSNIYNMETMGNNKWRIMRMKEMLDKKANDETKLW